MRGWDDLMASIFNYRGKFRASIRKQGFARQVKDFLSYAEAKQWADEVEGIIEKERKMKRSGKIWKFNTYKPNFNIQLDDVLCSKIDFAQTRGIYFLIHKNEIIYIGKSIHIFRRITQHYLNKKEFDAFFYFKCNIDDMDALEKFYIKKFKPKRRVQRQFLSCDFMEYFCAAKP